MQNTIICTKMTILILFELTVFPNSGWAKWKVNVIRSSSSSWKGHTLSHLPVSFIAPLVTRVDYLYSNYFYFVKPDTNYALKLKKGLYCFKFVFKFPISFAFRTLFFIVTSCDKDQWSHFLQQFFAAWRERLSVCSGECHACVPEARVTRSGLKTRPRSLTRVAEGRLILSWRWGLVGPETLAHARVDCKMVRQRYFSSRRGCEGWLPLSEEDLRVKL